MSIENNPELISHYQSLAKTYVEGQRENMLQVVGGDQKLSIEAIKDSPITANVVLSVIGVGYVKIIVTMTIDGEDIKFEGEGGGLIVGAGGISFCAGISGFSRAQLVGQRMNFNLAVNTPSNPGQISLMIDQQVFGPKVVMHGAALVVAAGVATGTGTWGK
ncbi:hypothetical protein [Arenicella xantha]|uniref:Uncharacterized protein n=1 Tax=Arenicella xantha TaxID=644221 RepID=A0A395JFM7_9GAMM|nr:hypothetical protein [Arenicella xantha]RBP48560.1 hypothetical protein DFR28_10646 [Arenicella xantha]